MYHIISNSKYYKQLSSSFLLVEPKMEKAKPENIFSRGEEDGYDVVVVGSGYGGSVAACRSSMAGLKVCLVEKGRRWEAQDFPTSSLKILSTFRFESSKLGISFGPRDALFQVSLFILSLINDLKRENYLISPQFLHVSKLIFEQ